MNVVSNPAITYAVKVGTAQTSSALFLNVVSHDVLNADLLAPAAATYTLTDVTNYVTQVTFRRGRQRTTDRFDAASGTLELFDPERRFDPTNTAGPYYGKLHAGYPLEVTANGIAIFTGWITAWDYQPSPGDVGRARVTFADTLQLFAQSRLQTQQTYGAQTSGARILALMANASFQPQYVVDAGEVTLSAATYDAGTVILDAMYDAAEAEWGKLYTDRLGRIAFLDRTQPATAGYVTIRPDQVPGAAQYAAIGQEYATEVYPIANVTDDAGGVQTSQDLQYLLDYNGQAFAVTAGLLTAARASTLAALITSRYAQPFERPVNAELHLTGKMPTGVQEDLFELDLAMSVKVIRTYPTGAPSSITDDYWVESIEHTITRQGHTMRLSAGLPS